MAMAQPKRSTSQKAQLFEVLYSRRKEPNSFPSLSLTNQISVHRVQTLKTPPPTILGLSFVCYHCVQTWYQTDSEIMKRAPFYITH